MGEAVDDPVERMNLSCPSVVIFSGWYCWPQDSKAASRIVPYVTRQLTLMRQY
jgi:hypothetical protein